MFRSKTEVTKCLDEESLKAKESILNTLVHNLEPDMAVEVKRCWIEPDKFAAYQLLGKGIMGTFNNTARSDVI